MQPPPLITCHPRLSAITPTAQAISVSRIDRWFIYHRLQELMIPCWCPEDGSLWVDIKDGIAAILVQSVIQQFLSPRQELVSWLEQCWHLKERK
jgi:hypothetical protein